jgi:hypothetical protein
MMLGLGLFAAGGQGGGTPFDPTSWDWEGFWDAPYGGSPWAGTASAGDSGSRSLSEGTNAPSVGATLNGYATADFDGTNDLLAPGLNWSVLCSASNGYVGVLFNADALVSPGTTYDNPALVGDGSVGAVAGLFLNTSGVFAFINDSGGAKVTTPIAVSTSAWHYAEMRWSGGLLECRLDRGSWTSVAAGAIVFDTQPVRVGANYNASKCFNGKIARIFMDNVAPTNGESNDFVDSVNTKFATAF